MDVIDVGLWPTPLLIGQGAALGSLLGGRYRVVDGEVAERGVVVLDGASIPVIAETRLRAPQLGIIVLMADDGLVDPRAVVSLIEAGADVCLVAPGAAGLAAHVRALAAHHPRAHAPACVA
jgi:hypothetical protein